jgi:hypothetical protein
VTFRVTNAKGVKPSSWVYAARTRCPIPCSPVSFRIQLQTAAKWRARPQVYVWGGTSYVSQSTTKIVADCRGDSGAVSKGYGVETRIELQMSRAIDGRVVAFGGRGTDSYIPNDVYAVTGRAR